MHVLLLILFPLLYLFNPYLAMGALIAAIVVMYTQRTRPARRQKRAYEPEYKPGYED